MTSREYGTPTRRSLFSAVDDVPGDRPRLVGPDGAALTEHGRRIERNWENWRLSGHMPDVDPNHPGQWARFVAAFLDHSIISKLDERVLRVILLGVPHPTSVREAVFRRSFGLENAGELLHSTDPAEVIDQSADVIGRRFTALFETSRRREDADTRQDVLLLRAVDDGEPVLERPDALARDRSAAFASAMFDPNDPVDVSVNLAAFARRHRPDATPDLVAAASEHVRNSLPYAREILATLLDCPDDAVPYMVNSRALLSTLVKNLSPLQLDQSATVMGCLMYVQRQRDEA